MTEILIVQKVAHILASLFEREWFSYLFSDMRKISYELEKNGKFLFAKKILIEKNFDINFNLERSLHKLRKITETMNPIFILGHEIYEFQSSKKDSRSNFENN